MTEFPRDKAPTGPTLGYLGRPPSGPQEGHTLQPVARPHRARHVWGPPEGRQPGPRFARQGPQPSAETVFNCRSPSPPSSDLSSQICQNAVTGSSCFRHPAPASRMGDTLFSLQNLRVPPWRGRGAPVVIDAGAWHMKAGWVGEEQPAPASPLVPFLSSRVSSRPFPLSLKS